MRALAELDAVAGPLIEGLVRSLGKDTVLLVASEYVITEVDHVVYPNRVLREAGLLAIQQTDHGELIDFEQSRAWALVTISSRMFSSVREILESLPRDATVPTLRGDRPGFVGRRPRQVPC